MKMLSVESSESTAIISMSYGIIVCRDPPTKYNIDTIICTDMEYYSSTHVQVLIVGLKY